LSFRIEEKLFIKKENLIEFLEFFNKKSAKQVYEPRNIQSLYFDNINFQTYSDSIEGLVPRKKIRIRNYPNHKDNKYYYEIKNSSIEGRFKTRKMIDKKIYQQNINDGIFDSQYGTCYPKLYVKYLRKYLILNDVRISIDDNIEYKDFQSNYTYTDDKIIVELKTFFKKNVDDLYKDFPFQRVRFSKYCFGVEKIFNKIF
tara:strand:+ start:157 stop:756 length:600 start_codon:yes stop_codon:yes gene_type:complete